MQPDHEPSASPNALPEQLDDVVPIQKITSRGSAFSKEAISLKRGREGSLEPYPTEAPQQTPAMTKKNRLAPTSSLGDRGSADLPNTHVEGEPEEHEPEAEPGPNDAKEGQTVGEVRRKVEKMTYEEGSGGPGNTKAAAPIGSAGRETITGDAEMVRTDTGDDSAEWEKIDKAEVEVEADDVQSGGDGLKRKAPDQCESSLAQGNGGGEGVKRQKDTPSPPSKPNSVPLPSAQDPPKKPQTSFSAFSSSASPFAAVRSASPFASAAPAAVTSSKPSPFTSSGFENYSSTFSPFGAKKTALDEREKSEDNEVEIEAGPSTFGDILKSGPAEKDGTAGDDAELKVHMTEQDVPTGEEDEETLYQTRAKLYVMQSDGGWKERGTGTLRLNMRRSDGRGARLVMRAEGVLRLILNVNLYAGMACLEDGKYVRTTVFEENERRFITFRTASNKTAMELSGAIIDTIPLDPSSSPDPRAGEDSEGVGSADDAVLVEREEEERPAGEQV